jgi:2-octaprenyl-6-methoxyphenol hydroxylase
VNTDQAEEMLEWPEEYFLEQAQARFGDTLGNFVKIGQRSSYPLRLVRALEDFRSRVVLLGNAAHAIHPVGAQGFNLGLRDVAVLAEVLHDAMLMNLQADPGNMDLLKKYSEWRASDQQGTIAYSDGMARIFSNPSPLVAAARTAGLFAHALFPPLRRQVAIRSMGFRGNTPRLALGESLGELS